MTSAISAYSNSIVYQNAVMESSVSEKQPISPSLPTSEEKKSTDSEITISNEAKTLFKEEKFKEEQSQQGLFPQEKSLPNQQKLTEEELEQVQKLQARDREVRTHEQAHQSAAGSLSNGGASFEYQSGPDGKRYAVGGEVSIDTSKVANDPQATIAKARQIRSAALAPANPSGQDRQVAAQSVKMEAEATQELAAKRLEESTIGKESSTESEKSSTDGKSEIPSAGIKTPSAMDEVNDSDDSNSFKTDFYKQVQSSVSEYNNYGQSTGGVSRLDYYT